MPEYKALSAIKQVELQKEVKALRQREAELSALTEELMSVLRNIAYEGPDANAQTLMGWALDIVDQVPSGGKPLHNRDMRIAEAVREACADFYARGWNCDFNPADIEQAVRSLDLHTILERLHHAP